MRWLKSLAINGSLIVGATVFALLLGELFIRWYSPQQLIVPNANIWRPDNQIGWRHRANVRTSLNTGEGIVTFVTDADGFRVNRDNTMVTLATPDLSVIAIGDSFIEALQVENRNAIPSLLQDHLSNHFDKFIKFTNDAVGGWNPNQYLKETKMILSNHTFDLGIVFLYAANDIVTERTSIFSPQLVSSRHSFHWPKEWTHRGLVQAIAYPINDMLEVRSHLFVFLKTRMRNTLAHLGLTAAYFPAVFETAERESLRWSTTSAICKDVQREFRMHNSDVLFVLLPSIYQVYQDEFDAYVDMFKLNPATIDLEQPNKELAAAFAKDSLPLIDPLDFLRAQAKDRAAMYGAVDNHFTVDGHLAVSDFLKPHVEKAVVEALRKRNVTLTQVR